MHFALRYDLRAPDFAVPQADLIDACLAQCAWADELGFSSVGVLEHHGSTDGYNPAPFVLAAAIAARTRRLRIRFTALVLPLHDPITVAEDVAVLDQLSRGRVEIVVGAGYAAHEFAMFGRRLEDRVQLQTDGIALLRRAWTGEPFVHLGNTVRVTPRPYQRPHPPLLLGGASAGAARRAARIADGFEAVDPALNAIYLAECAALGRDPGPVRPPGLAGMFTYLAQDPDAAWKVIAPHALHETNSYGQWLAASGAAGPFRALSSAAELRASGIYHVLTPAEFLAQCRSLGPAAGLIFHPLMGGLEPEFAWRSLRLFETQVLPALLAEGLV